MLKEMFNPASLFSSNGQTLEKAQELEKVVHSQKVKTLATIFAMSILFAVIALGVIEVVKQYILGLDIIGITGLY